MALAATIVFEVRTGGSDNNGGGFKTAASGVDYSQQNAAQYALTGVTTAAADAICLSASAATDMVGNLCQIVSGTNFTVGIYEIISVVAGVSFTLDRTCTSAAGALGVINVGGAFATPGKAAAIATVDGHSIWVKTGTYNISTATAGAAGPVLFASGINVKMEGYSVTRGDRASPPTLRANSVAGTYNLFGAQGTPAAFQEFINLISDGTNTNNVSGFSGNIGRSSVIQCEAKNHAGTGARGFDINGVAMSCKATGALTGFRTAGGRLMGCWADGGTTGFNNLTTPSTMVKCLASDNSGDGFLANVAGAHFFYCTADGNGGDGFDVSAAVPMFLFGCVSSDNTGFQYNTSANVGMDTCASWLNGKGARVNVAPAWDLNNNATGLPATLILTGDPWVAASTDDYRPNNTSGAGANLRSITVMGVSGQTDNKDIGAVEHSGGLLTHPGMAGGMRA